MLDLVERNVDIIILNEVFENTAMDAKGLDFFTCRHQYPSISMEGEQLHRRSGRSRLPAYPNLADSTCFPRPRMSMSSDSTQLDKNRISVASNM